HGLHFVGTHAAEIDLRSGVNVRQVTRPRDGALDRRSVRGAQRLDGHAHLHRADGDERGSVANFHHAPYTTTERRDLDERTCLDRVCSTRNRGLSALGDIRFLALESLELLRLLSRELLGLLSRFASRFLHGFGAGALQILDRALDLGARVEQISPRFLARLTLHVSLALADVAFAFDHFADASSRVIEQLGELSLAPRDLLLATL